ncbi:hypothetical protein [Micromonospora cathayae]|uniref:Uncharacterized protein n=1 Tax=Micromonospora cathayae TaxID=3028804 RepID=A0ABY7ZRG4_9ACTN|nr:hypothetical protein [Micromonospora sp. HUAS 3]WDZ84539.1 hypothetical protein PVK37_29575 [Micromonospora sp. HUAS 3]
MHRANASTAPQQDVINGLKTLTENQHRMVASVVRALRTPTEFIANSSSDLVDDPFIETMANFLVLHHALHEEPLSKKPFEYVFRQCLLAQGKSAELNSTPGASPHDVRGGGYNWSLKTEAAKGISPQQVKIEKLMEARWIRECLTPEDCANAVRQRVPHHLAGYDRILVLRAFSKMSETIYKLIEVPTRALADRLSQAVPEMFSKTKGSPSFGADFYDSNSGARVFRILLDSSVEKIRLSHSAEWCTHHGTWIIPKDQELSLDYQTSIG